MPTSEMYKESVKITHLKYSLIWPIRGSAAGPGNGFRLFCPKQGYIISHDSVLNTVHNFA